jgi:DNA polymerase-3 subunit beta
MELRIHKDELERALSRAQGVAGKKSTMPILSSVLVEAKKDHVAVSAYDLEVGLRGEYAAEVAKEGAVAADARALYEITRALPVGTVHVKKAQNNRLNLSCGAAEFNIVGSAAEDYPAMPKVEKVSLVTVDAKALLDMIEKTQFAISSDEARFALNGVYFEPITGAGGGGVRMVATDGHRLALVERELEGDFKLKRGVIIPRKGLLEVKRLLAEEGEEAKIGFTDNSGIFQRGKVMLVMRLVDGQFPDYTQVIPRESDRVVHLERGRFLDTLKRVSLLSTDKGNAVRLDLGENLLRVTSQNPDLGDAREDIPVEFKGGAIRIGFNARYLIDFLSAAETEKVKLELSDELSPGVLKPVDGMKYTAVVMPMRI